jgi:hypothetical protein
LFSFSTAEEEGNPAEALNYFKTPGFPVANLINTISLDGSTAYISDKFDPGYDNYNTAAYSLNEQVELSSPAPTANFKFLSYDTSFTGTASTFISEFSNSWVTTGGVPGQFLALSNGNVLSSLTSSLYAFNVLNLTFYCYAGTEQGLFGNVPAVQDQSTGRAKYVNFTLNGNITYLIGTDALGAVYYFTAPATFIQPVYSGPITFYKLYSKQ